MFLRAFLAGTVALPLLPAAAGAVITADDVIANLDALYGAFGFDFATDEVRDGAIVVLPGTTMTLSLPFGIGTISAQTGGMTLTDQPDGTVLVKYPPESPFRIVVDLAIDGETARVEVDLTLRFQDFAGTASGEPGDITYVSDIGLMDYALDDIRLQSSQGDDLDGMKVTAFLTMTDIHSELRVTEGDLFGITSDTRYGPVVYDFEITDDTTGPVMNVAGNSAAGSTTLAVNLPRSGVDVMNLAAALRTGMTIHAETRTEGDSSRTRTAIPGQGATEQIQSADVTETRFDLSQSGLSLYFGTEGMAIDMPEDPMLPVPLQIGLGAGWFRMDIPVMASTEPQPAHLGFQLSGLTMGDAVWGLFDPGQSLPRDPAHLAFEMSAVTRLDADILDFAALPTVFERIDSQGILPGRVDSVDVTVANAWAVGVEILGKAAFTFDWTGVAEGLPPKPVGTAEAEITGVNALIDRLVAGGIITGQEVAAARAGMGMVLRPTGADAFTTRFEATADGGVLINGAPVPF